MGDMLRIKSILVTKNILSCDVALSMSVQLIFEHLIDICVWLM